MKIIQVHNYYQEPGGEDSVVAAERNMLQEAGHTVIPIIKIMMVLSGIWQLFIVSLKSLWNYKVYSEFQVNFKKRLSRCCSLSQYLSIDFTGTLLGMCVREYSCCSDVT